MTKLTKRNALATIALTTSILLGSCSLFDVNNLTSAPVVPEVIGGGHNCNLGNTAFAAWIQNQDELAHWQQQMNNMLSLSTPAPATEVNFQQQAVVLVYLGQKSSGGYGIKVLPQPIQLAEKSATVYIEWQAPSAGMMVTQALTSPCTLFKFPAGNFDEIKLIDENTPTRVVLMRP